MNFSRIQELANQGQAYVQKAVATVQNEFKDPNTVKKVAVITLAFVAGFVIRNPLELAVDTAIVFVVGRMAPEKAKELKDKLQEIINKSIAYLPATAGVLVVGVIMAPTLTSLVVMKGLALYAGTYLAGRFPSNPPVDPVQVQT